MTDVEDLPTLNPEQAAALIKETERSIKRFIKAAKTAARSDRALARTIRKEAENPAVFPQWRTMCGQCADTMDKMAAALEDATKQSKQIIDAIHGKRVDRCSTMKPSIV